MSNIDRILNTIRTNDESCKDLCSNQHQHQLVGVTAQCGSHTYDHVQCEPWGKTEWESKGDVKMRPDYWNGLCGNTHPSHYSAVTWFWKTPNSVGEFWKKWGTSLFWATKQFIVYSCLLRINPLIVSSETVSDGGIWGFLANPWFQKSKMLAFAPDPKTFLFSTPSFVPLKNIWGTCQNKFPGGT